MPQKLAGKGWRQKGLAKSTPKTYRTQTRPKRTAAKGQHEKKQPTNGPIIAYVEAQTGKPAI